MLKKKEKDMAKTDKGDFWSRAGETTKKGYRVTKEKAIKVGSKGARSYGRYVAPTVGLFKKAGSVALCAGKLALRNPGIGLVATGLYYGGKAIGTRAGAKKFKYPNYREFNKKGRKII